MGMEVEFEAEIEEEFKDYTLRQKIDLIWEILRGGSMTVVGQVSSEIEPPDYH